MARPERPVHKPFRALVAFEDINLSFQVMHHDNAIARMMDCFEAPPQTHQNGYTESITKAGEYHEFPSIGFANLDDLSFTFVE